MVENILNRPDEVGLTKSFLNETCLQNPYVMCCTLKNILQNLN